MTRHRRTAAPALRRRIVRLARGAVIALGLAALHSAALAGDDALVRSAETPRVTATLAPEQRVAAPGTTVDVVFHQRILDGWHTYWKNPGDSGQRIDIRWTLPAGVIAAPLAFPVPEPIRYGSLVNHGYEDETALIGSLTIPADWPAGRPVEVAAHATWLVCEEVCIPEEAHFAFTLPTATTPSALEPVRDLFERARAALPRPAPWPVRITAQGEQLVLSVDAAPGALDLEDAWFFADDWGLIAHAVEQRARVRDGRAELLLTRGEIAPGETMSGVLRVSGAQAPGFTLSAPVTTLAAVTLPAAPVAENPGVLMLVVLAFAGGVLLNLMPCVFPVLAMKAMSLMKHASRPATARAAGALAYTAGVTLSFAALAATLLLFKAGGQAVGWGFHLQSPAVVAGLALVLFAVGLNLSGLLPVGGAWMGLGSGLAARDGLAGSFFTGVLAAVVAAPCTAPFMATAIGIALLQSGTVAMTVFLALGLGLAAPYVVFTCIPSLSARLPRPGPWMERAKQLLAFPMYASTSWLVWVLAQQSGADAVGLVLLAAVLLALAAWAWRAAAGAGRTARRLGRSFGAVAAAAALAATIGAGVQPPAGTAAIQTDDAAERYSPARVASVLAQGGAVFLNVTAAWCVTCKVNERIALSGDAFHSALSEHGVVYMKGDWTRQDPEITELLQRFGRAGVPLYVLFPRDGSTPRVLPQVLTGSIVGAALAGA